LLYNSIADMAACRDFPTNSLLVIDDAILLY